MLACALLACGPGAAARGSTAAQSPASTTARIAASLHPDRPGAKGQLDVSVSYSGAQGALPEPVRHAVLRLPQALGIDIPVLRSCSPARLRASGTRACPPQSQIGRGQALVEAMLGSQPLEERVALSLFIGPLVNLQPTFDILVQGETPFRERMVIAGSVVPDQPPYGEDLAIPLPAIATVPLEPDATIASLALTIGLPGAGPGRQVNSVVAPQRCPASGLPLEINSTFADGSADSAAYALPCPP